jgi:tetratricopeptide (TPR) repeat protein
MSEMEDWYVNFSHAYLKCGEYQKAIEIALEGMKTFPNELFLARTVALAHFRSGNTQAGVDMMRPLLNHPKCQWYIRSELAEMEIQLGNSDEAYRLLCQALLTKQEDQFKVKNLETYASLSIKMNRFREAKAAIAFASAIRTNAGWSLPDSLISLLSTCNSALQKEGGKLPETISHQAELAKICYGFWKEGALEGLERIRGKVTQIRPDRKYAFIQPEDGGDSVIVFLRDLPRDCSVENTPVEFSREKSFDVKKNRDSYKAVQIQRLNR